MSRSKSERCPGSGSPPDYIGKRTGKGACDHCYSAFVLRKDGMLPVHQRRVGPVEGGLTILNELMKGFLK